MAERAPLAKERPDTSDLLVHRHAEHRSEYCLGDAMTSEVMASMTDVSLSCCMTHAFTPHTSAPHTSLGSATPLVNTGAFDCERRLRFVLRANAASSTISGLAMAVVPGVVDNLLGTGHNGWVRLVGLSLLPFAAFVAWLSTADRRDLRLYTPVIVAGDIGWVVASIATVSLGWYSGMGIVAVLAMALVIGVFALLQFNAARHLARG